MSKIIIDELMAKINEVPPFSQQVNKILQMTDNPKTRAKEVEEEILKDQGLTMKVLKMANSAYYGVSRKVDTVEKAAVILGYRAIKSIVLTSAIGSTMKSDLPVYELEENALMKQSQACAYTARFIAKKVKYKEPDQAYIAGLLRDIGKVIIEEYLAEEYTKISNIVNIEQRPFDLVEKEVLGIGHAEIGAKLMERWQLPSDLVDAVAHHHDPFNSENNLKLAAITHIADAIIMMSGLHIGADGLQYELSQDALDYLGIDDEMIQGIISHVGDIIESGILFFEM